MYGVRYGSVRGVLGSKSAQVNTRRDTGKILHEDREEQGDAHKLLTSSCDDSRAQLVRMAVYSIREVRASE